MAFQPNSSPAGALAATTAVAYFSRFLQVWPLQLPWLFPAMPKAIRSFFKRHFRDELAPPAPIQTPLSPVLVGPSAACSSASGSAFPLSSEKILTIPSQKHSNRSLTSYEPSISESSDNPADEELRAFFAMSIPMHKPTILPFPLVNPAFGAEKYRLITPRPTPPPSPADEVGMAFSPAPSVGSNASSSWTSDGSSFRERVAARISQNRQARSIAEEKNPTGPPLVWNGDETYAIDGTIGSGAHGRVMYARNLQMQEVAIKVIHKAKAYRRNHGRLDIINELRALKRVTESDIAFVSPLLSAWSDEKNIYFVMPCFRETLLERIARLSLSKKELLIYSAELINAISNLHSCGVIHRDIKPENIIFDAYGHLVLSDFGLAHTTRSADISVTRAVLHDMVGTPGYWAPEIMTVTARDGYSWEVDIWSAGLVIYDMADGKVEAFYHGPTANDIRRCMMLYDVPIWNLEDEALRSLLARMIVRDPMCRWSAQNLLEHRFFAQLDLEAIATKDYKVMPPPELRVNFHKRSLRFSTFHNGHDSDGPNLHYDEYGNIKPNYNAIDHFLDDEEHPDAFKFLMNPVYQSDLLREFIYDDDTPFHSRHNPNPGPVHPRPPPPTRPSAILRSREPGLNEFPSS